MQCDHASKTLPYQHFDPLEHRHPWRHTNLTAMASAVAHIRRGSCGVLVAALGVSLLAQCSGEDEALSGGDAARDKQVEAGPGDAAEDRSEQGPTDGSSGGASGDGRADAMPVDAAGDRAVDVSQGGAGGGGQGGAAPMDAGRDSTVEASTDASADSSVPEQPEVIVLISTDDQRWDSLWAMPTVQTELVAKGVSFANAFASNPFCCPSRASLLTGNYPHTHGVEVVSSQSAPGFVGPDDETIAVWLRRAGYRTGFFGKYMNGYWNLCADGSCYVPPGWDEWNAFVRTHYYDYELSENGPTIMYGRDEADYSTDVLRDKALAFLDAHPAEPVFIYLAPFAPHSSTRTFQPIPAPRHEGAFDNIEDWRPASYMEADLTDKHMWLQNRPSFTPLEQALLELQRPNGLASLLAVDDALAALLARLESQGRIDRTAIIYTSDNGFSYGEHRVFGKGVAYEESIRIPLVVRHPALRNTPSERDELALVVDIAPTLRDWAGGTSPQVEGMSLAPLLVHGTAPWRQGALLEVEGPPFSEQPTYVGLRTATHKYVLFATGERELYDLQADPFELESIAASADPCFIAALEEAIEAEGATLPAAAMPCP